MHIFLLVSHLIHIGKLRFIVYPLSEQADLYAASLAAGDGVTTQTQFAECSSLLAGVVSLIKCVHSGSVTIMTIIAILARAVFKSKSGFFLSFLS